MSLKLKVPLTKSTSNYHRKFPQTGSPHPAEADETDREFTTQKKIEASDIIQAGDFSSLLNPWTRLTVN